MTSLIQPRPSGVSVIDYLDKHALPYQVVANSAVGTLSDIAAKQRLPLSAIVRAVLCKDEEDAILMVVLPISQMLDWGRLNIVMGRVLHPLKEVEVQQLFIGSESGYHPPFPYMRHMQVILDESLKGITPLYFTPGTYTSLVRMESEDYQQLLGGKVEFVSVCIPLTTFCEYADEEENRPIARMAEHFAERRFQQRVKNTAELPILPGTVHELLRLRMEPHATVADLAWVIEHDPSLAAQILSWACSPYYGYHGKVVSVEDAITSVLGFDLVNNLAISLSVGRTLPAAMEGVIGIKEYFKASICTAMLVEELIARMPAALQPMRGLGYAAGLLHNFGHLILAYLFPPQFRLLCDHILANPDVPLSQIERHVLGVSQNILATWLFESWQLPAEIITAVRWSTQETYSGKHATYAHLLFIASRLLRRAGIGHASSMVLPVWLMAALGLDEIAVQAALMNVIQHNDKLEILVQQVMA